MSSSSPFSNWETNSETLELHLTHTQVTPRGGWTSINLLIEVSLSEALASFQVPHRPGMRLDAHCQRLPWNHARADSQ